MTHPPPHPRPDAQARAAAYLVRDRFVDANELDDLHIDHGETGAVRLQVTVVLMLDPTTARILLDPPAEFDDEVGCPIDGHEHDPIDVVGAFDDVLVIECRTTRRQWNEPRPGILDRIDR